MKHKIISNIFISTSVAASFFLLQQKPAYASPVSLSVYPPVIEIETTSPANIKTPVIIQNNTDQNIKLSIGVKPFKASDNFNGQVSFYSPNYTPQPDQNIFNYITMINQNTSVNSLTLAPKDKKNLSLNINLPANEPTADYYFSLVFEAIPPNPSQNTSTIIQTGIVTNVLLSIGKRITPQAEIDNFSSPAFISRGPVPFTVLLKNDNNQILRAQGHILITNMFGQTIADVNISKEYILAFSQRYLSNGYSNNNQPVSLWNKSFLLGPYSAKLQVSLSNKGPIIEKTIHFFAFPSQAVLILVLALILVMLISKRVRNKLYKKTKI